MTLDEALELVIDAAQSYHGDLGNGEKPYAYSLLEAIYLVKKHREVTREQLRQWSLAHEDNFMENHTDYDVEENAVDTVIVNHEWLADLLKHLLTKGVVPYTIADMKSDVDRRCNVRRS